MKGHGGGKNRARQYYGVMLCLAFGAAILGVMAVHKLRERRILNLLLKEKDRDLLSLHLLLQKEREYNKETKRKSQEMKAKIHSLRTQKMDLDGRILEMQTTISSLKDEQRIMELALEEKQNEMKLLREKEIEASKEHPRIIALSETLKQKEAQIQDLQRLLENPSNSTVNLTKTEGTKWRDTKEAAGELSDNPEEARDEAVGVRRFEGERSIELPGLKEEKNDTAATDAILNQGNGLKSNEALGGKELGMAWNGETDTRPQGRGGGGGDGESQQFGMMNASAGKKLETSDNSQALTGHKKRWRTIARNRRHRSSRNAEKGEDLSTRRRKFHKGALGSGDDELQKLEPNQGDGNMSSQLNDELGQGNGELEFHGNHPEGQSSEFKNEEQARVEKRGGDGGKTVAGEVEPVKAHNSGDMENESTQSGNTVLGQQIEEGQKVQLGKSKEEVTTEQLERETEGDKKDQNSESNQVGEKHEASEDLASERTWKAELDVEESRTNVEEEKEGEEETGEPEF